MKAAQSTSAPRVFMSSLRLVATSYALRCDAKFADADFLKIDAKIRAAGSVSLGELLPTPLSKGIQPTYLDQPTEDSVPVINTLSIQNLTIREEDCRHILREDYDELSAERKLTRDDVLLTVDGGVSIGKPVLFDKEKPYTVDSHIVILRPQGISPLGLVYLLASPVGQLQFRRAESGASGQTTVTEDDIRRFIFPRATLSNIDKIVVQIENERQRIFEARAELAKQEAALWTRLDAFGL